MAEVLQCMSPNRFMEVGVPLPHQVVEEPVKPENSSPARTKRAWAWALLTIVVLTCGIVYVLYLEGKFESPQEPDGGGSGWVNETAAPTVTTPAPSPSIITPTLRPSMTPAPAGYTVNTPPQQQMTSPPTTKAAQLTYTGWCSASTPCFECEGQCFSKEDCHGDLVCFVRAGFTNIPGCAGSGIYGVSYCYQMAKPALTFERECSSTNQCGLCEGMYCRRECEVMIFSAETVISFEVYERHRRLRPR